MKFKESKNFLTEENKKFIEETILSNNFPFYLFKGSTKDQEDPIFMHIILNRMDQCDPRNLVNSLFYEPSLDILNNFCKSIKLKVNFFTRIAYNITFNNKFEKCGIHKDHKFQHNQIIIYLNDCDTNSKTYILKNNKKEIQKIITPEKYKGVVFDNYPHYHVYPKFGHRLVLVATFI